MKKALLTILGAVLITFSVNAQTQPGNPDFENWESLPFGAGTMQEPINWNTSNQCTSLLNVTPVTQSTDAHSGSFSARLESHPGPSTIVVNGVLTTADMICGLSDGGQEGGSSYTDIIPDSIIGWYKYAPANSDSAYSQIMFLANNDQDTVSFSRVNFTNAASTWTRFSAPITPATGAAEKLSLFFSSSWGDGAAGEGEIGSVFFVDDVEFVFNPLGVNEAYNAEGWDVYPNPTVNGVVNVKGTSTQTAYIELLDITGKQVLYTKLAGMSTSVDVSNLVAGIYLYQITESEGHAIRTGKLIVRP